MSRGNELSTFGLSDTIYFFAYCTIPITHLAFCTSIVSGRLRLINDDTNL